MTPDLSDGAPTRRRRLGIVWDKGTRAAPLDCLVVGGGPAGLTAAIDLARFYLDVLVIDAGKGRAAMIPLSRNHPGFPEGISGRDLLSRMRAQAERYGARIRRATVAGLRREGALYVARTGQGEIHARTILLATGVVNSRPEMAEEDHDAALARGLLRYCPICDGFEVTDRRVGLIGSGAGAAKEAEFMRSYTSDVTLISPDGVHDLAAPDRARLETAGIALVEGPCLGYALGEDTIEVALGGESLRFATLYVALGTEPRSDLARGLGAEMSDEGCPSIDHHQRTSLPGLFAAGDLVEGLDQLSWASGQGAVAATAIRNDVAAVRPLRREELAKPLRSRPAVSQRRA